MFARNRVNVTRGYFFDSFSDLLVKYSMFIAASNLGKFMQMTRGQEFTKVLIKPLKPARAFPFTLVFALLSLITDNNNINKTKSSQQNG